MAAVSVKLNPIGVALVVFIVFGLLLYVFGIPKFFRSEPKVNMKELLSVSIVLAKRGGECVKKVREDQDKLNQKVKGKTAEGAPEYLTDGDLQSHRAIVNGFSKAYPELKASTRRLMASDAVLKVISEEHDKPPVDFHVIPRADKHNKELDDISGDQHIPVSDIAVWIDPLDATQEYTENLRQYVTTMVCVAVIGQPTIGVIHQPFTGKTVWGWVGYGHSKNLQVADDKKDEEKAKKPKRIIVSRSHKGEVEAVAKKAFGNDTQIIPAGGAGYKTLQVIQGKADAYVHVTKIKKWDTCAGGAIIASVNGRMTTIENRNIDYSMSGNLVNNAGVLATLHQHDMFLNTLKPAFEHMKKSEAKKHKDKRHTRSKGT